MTLFPDTAKVSFTPRLGEGTAFHLFPLQSDAVRELDNLPVASPVPRICFPMVNPPSSLLESSKYTCTSFLKVSGKTVFSFEKLLPNLL